MLTFIFGWVVYFYYFCGMKYKKAYKYFKKSDIVEMFGYSSVGSFTNSSSFDRKMRGIEAVIERVERGCRDVLVRAIKDLDCSITHCDKKDMK